MLFVFVQFLQGLGDQFDCEFISESVLVRVWPSTGKQQAP